MQIKLNENADEIVITNEHCEGNFVDILIGDQEATVDVEELHCAVMSFIIKKDRKSNLQIEC